MENPAQKLKKVAELGAAAKAIDRDIKTFQMARQTFVASVRVWPCETVFVCSCHSLPCTQLDADNTCCHRSVWRKRMFQTL